MRNLNIVAGTKNREPAPYGPLGYMHIDRDSTEASGKNPSSPISVNNAVQIQPDC